MKVLRIYGLMFVALLALFNNSMALDKTEIVEYLNKSLSNLKSVSFSFEDVDEPKLAGNIKASVGNKYKIIKSGRTICCNAKKIWNYTSRDNKVLVSDFDASHAGLSIENIFFNLMKNAKVSQFKKETSTKITKGLYVCVLNVETAYAEKNKIDKVKIWVDSRKKIRYIASIYQNETQMWKIENLQLNPKLADSIYNFSAPKDCKVIELD
ncbi:MAG: hypothetical protein PHV24_08400 [Candidatus Kapabacteria bacterium]|nr:hypothetical protein [Candidatus Kapabacteria bacterium]